MIILVETKSSYISFRDVYNVVIENGRVNIIFDDDRVQTISNVDNITILGV